MIKIAYHPAYDPYHTAFRLLRLFACKPKETFEIDSLRILDFYLAFPRLAGDIDGVKILVKKYGLMEWPSTYGAQPSASVIFNQMKPIQDAAIQTLYQQNIVDFDKDSLLHGDVSLSENGIPRGLVPVLVERNKSERPLIQFLMELLLKYPLDGHNGLKHRTGLMEYRYDYA